MSEMGSVDRIYVQRSPEFERRVDERYHGEGNTTAFVSIVEYLPSRASDTDCEIKYDYDVLEQLFTGPVPDTVLDLVELSVATLAVDRYLKREVVAGEGVDDVDARLNTRSVLIRVPVLSASFATPRVAELLSTLVSHMTRDLIQFELIHHASAQPSVVPDYGRDAARVDAVSLFSDGLDSAGGVCQNRRDGMKARYVSVRYGSGLSKEAYGTACEELAVDPIEFNVSYSGRSKEYTTFSRGFLHWAFATAAAIAVDASEVRAFETGLMARFALLNEAWHTTRTVSPRAVELFNQIVAEATEYPVSVVNPFVEETKREVVERIESEAVVRNAVSCPHTGWQGEYTLKNCGQCVPCLVRNVAILQSRFSISPAELSICDWSKIDFAANELPVKQPTVKPGRNDADTFLLALHEIAYLARALTTQTPRDVVAEYPQLASPGTYDLYRRFADEFQSCFKDLATENSTSMSLL